MGANPLLVPLEGVGPRNESFLAAELGIQWAIFLIFSLWIHATGDKY
jgi:hypothetical protein